MSHIHIDMILMAVVVLTILFCPAGIRILLPLLLFASIFWNLSFLDSLILFPTVPLLRYGNKAGVYNLPLGGARNSVSTPPPWIESLAID